MHSEENYLMIGNTRWHWASKIKKDNVLNVLSKKPFIPTDNEISLNKRSRSAKMRVGEKIG